MVGTRQKPEHSVKLRVVIRVIDVLAEGKAWLARTGGYGGLSGSHSRRRLAKAVVSDNSHPLQQKRKKIIHSVLGEEQIFTIPLDSNVLKQLYQT